MELNFLRILYTDTAFTYTQSEQGYLDTVLIFTNVENNCYISFYRIAYQEQFIVPAKSYYCIIDTRYNYGYENYGLFYLVREESGNGEELPNVRVFYRGIKESIILHNININQWVAP